MTPEQFAYWQSQIMRHLKSEFIELPEDIKTAEDFYAWIHDIGGGSSN